MIMNLLLAGGNMYFMKLVEMHISWLILYEKNILTTNYGAGSLFTDFRSIDSQLDVV